jgi:hypothetical protein
MLNWANICWPLVITICNSLVLCPAGYFPALTCIASFTRGIMNGRHQSQWLQCTVIQLSTYSQMCCLYSLDHSSWDHIWPLSGCGSHWYSWAPSKIIQGTICHFFHHLNFMTFITWSKLYTCLWANQCYCRHICTFYIMLAQITTKIIQYSS